MADSHQDVAGARFDVPERNLSSCRKFEGILFDSNRTHSTPPGGGEKRAQNRYKTKSTNRGNVAGHQGCRCAQRDDGREKGDADSRRSKRLWLLLNVA